MNEIFQSLTKLIKQYDNFIIVSHANVDLDGLSSAICLDYIIQSLGKKSSIFFYNKSDNSSVNKALKKLKEKNFIFSFTSNLKSIKNGKDTLLIVLDTHRAILLEEPELLNIIPNVAIIDHHIKIGDYIKDTVFNYINANASSVVEIVTNYLQYMNQKISPILATIMLAGLEIDTNSYQIKATENTHSAATFLLKMGADNVLKQELLQEDRKKFIARFKKLDNSYIYNKKYSICVLEDEKCSREELAILSEIQLKFEHIEATFTIGYINDKIVGISARSLGRVDVEKIMNMMGGGGHVTDAAAQVMNQEIKQVIKTLEKILS